MIWDYIGCAVCFDSLKRNGLYEKEIELLSDLTYYVLTTLSGYQMLGEEYVSIIQVDPSKTEAPQMSWKLMPLSHVRLWIQRAVGMLTESQRKSLIPLVFALQQGITLLYRLHVAVFYIAGVGKTVGKIRSSCPEQNHTTNPNCMLIVTHL
uniref:RING-type E3 ubiquitin transferase n=2 Tax=Cyprinus carpio TaxID=7962 RepID=A0A8C1H4A4_CYPCA